eukprot:6965681-Pyramimonas_sp.AAC.1
MSTAPLACSTDADSRCMPSATPAEDRTPATRTCGGSELVPVFYGSLDNYMQMQAALWGPLPGKTQAVARGELLPLVIAV